MTKKRFTFKNVTVSFSTMLNKPDKCKYGRNFMVKVPLDHPELEEMKKAYKELNEKAKLQFGEKLEKKLKNATSVDDVFAESIHNEGFVELKFNIYFNKEREVTNADGTKTKTTELMLNPIYENPNFTYKIDNNGKKAFETPKGNPWFPASGNIIDVEVELKAKYDSKNNKPSIQLKAYEVNLVHSELGSNNSGSKSSYGFISLDDEDEIIEKKVEKAPVKEEESGTFTASDLEALDV